jgi:NTP pyrophosphatase (non-canonical NTP hydrolase)
MSELARYDSDSKFDLIREWAENRNLIDGATPESQFEKLMEEQTELYHGLRMKNLDETVDAIGDMVVVLTIMASQIGVPIEECINSAYREIKDRKGKMIDGVFVKEAR